MLAHTSNNGYPIFNADILITAPSNPETDPPAEPIPLGQTKVYSGRVAVDQRQKIFILKDNCCIGFAGDTDNIRLFLEDLGVFVRAHDTLTAEVIQCFIDNYGLDEFNTPIHFILSIVERNGSRLSPQVIKYGELRSCETSAFGEVIAIGSGADDFLKAAKAHDDVGSQPPRSFKQAIERTQSLVTELFTLDHYTEKYRNHHWGTGIETVFFDGKKFRRFENVAYLFSLVQRLNGVWQFTGRFEVIHYRYIGDFLSVLVVGGQVERQRQLGNKLIVEIPLFVAKINIVSPLGSDRVFNDRNIGKLTSFECDRVSTGNMLVIAPDGADFSRIVEMGKPQYAWGYYDNDGIRIELHSGGALTLTLSSQALLTMVKSFANGRQEEARAIHL